jgi:hypothetical protein
LTKTYTYSLFNLIVSSELELPGLLKSSGIPDVTIKYGETPETLGPTSHKGVLYEALSAKFLLKALDAAHFYVTDGKYITIRPLENYSPKTARVFLLSSVLGALLHQRSLLPMHASAIEYYGKSVLFAGVSGAGKSTLAAFLSKKGFSILSDDIAAIQTNNGKSSILPGIPHLKLWKDAVSKLKLPLEGLNKLRDGVDKYIDYTITPTHLSFPITYIFILSSQNSNGITINAIKGKDKFITLKNHVYRKQFITALGQEKNIFYTISTLASNIKMYRIIRPVDGFHVEEIADRILEIIKEKNDR